MSHADFLNTNEYRQYPIVPVGANQLDTQLIVDCGFVMGLDSDFSPNTDVVYLSAVRRLGNELEIEFRTTAAGAASYPLIFTRAIDAAEFTEEYIESTTSGKPCATDPVWEGFIVSGSVAGLFSELTDGAVKTFSNYSATVEPARIQTLKNGYLRSVSVGNYPRIVSPPRSCDSSSSSSSSSAQSRVIVNATCLSGAIKIKPGINCEVRQQAYANTIVISAVKDANATDSAAAELCENSGEIKLYQEETPPLLVSGDDEPSKFLSGGLACDQTITSINGLGGPAVKIVGGAGIRVVRDPNDPHGLKIITADNVITNKC